jgi:MFS transporter, DHA1 family, multidrug resistance protein
VLGGLVGARSARSVAPGIQAAFGLALAAAAVSLDVVIAAKHWSFPPLTFTPGMLYAFGLVLVTPVATTQTLAHASQNAGIVSSCQIFLQMLGMALAAWIVVPLVQHSLIALACSKAALLAGACLLWFASSTLQPMRPATA